MNNPGTYVIAEIGGNHNGSFDMACEMIKKLSNSTINAIKFQLGDPSSVYSNDAFLPDYQVNDKTDAKLSVIESANNRSLKRTEHLKLYELCSYYEMDYLCSAFDLESLMFLNENMNLKYFKIPSGEIFSIDMLDYMSNINKPIILSTGMATIDEIKITIDLLNKKKEKDITILHCISKYPTHLKDINMRFFNTLKKEFGDNIGFSDHTTYNESSLTAVAMGAKVIEKHVTLNKNLDGPDHQASSEISEFLDLVESIRKIEIIMGENKKTLSPEELQISNTSRKSIVSNKILKVGHKISLKDVTFKRPGTGIYPVYLDTILNKTVKKEIQNNHIIKLEDLSD